MGEAGGGYRCIVADPPWEYDAFPTHIGGRYPKGRHAKAPMPYPTLSIDQIAQLPIQQLAHRDSHLFLWTTNRYLPDAFQIIEAWGFTYGQAFVWVKSGTPTPFPAMLAPNHAEYMLACRRGRPARADTYPSNVIAAPMDRSMEHSQKPEVFMDIIEQVTHGPRIELFSRRARLGWDTWGNESLHGGTVVSAP